MQKTRSIAQIYLRQTSFSKWDIIFALAVVLSVVLFFISLWFAIPLLASVICLLLSRSTHVSDKDYEQLLSHLLAFNAVREERQDGYEELYQFFVIGYHEKTSFVDFYIQGYDLGKGLVRCGDDKNLRSGFYRLTHLHFTDTHCILYTCEANMIDNTVTAERRIVPRTADYKITPKTVYYRGGQKNIYYLTLPYCPPIPVHGDNTELEEILSYFKDI